MTPRRVVTVDMWPRKYLDINMALTNAEKLRIWRKNNPDKVKSQKQRHKERYPNAAKEYRERTKERAAETRLEWQRNNKDKVSTSCKKWRDENPDKNRAKSLRYRASKLQRTVGWDDELTDFATKEASELCVIRREAFGFDWHVDHVVPLQGINVSGLHVWNNLAVIPASENVRKSNFF